MGNPLNFGDATGKAPFFFDNPPPIFDKMVSSGQPIGTPTNAAINALVGVGIFGWAAWAAFGPAVVAALAPATVIAGPYASTTAEKLRQLACSNGPTLRVVTNLTQAPIAGRSLSVSFGSNAGQLAAATNRAAFSADIPRALITELERTGLVRGAISNMGAIEGGELQFNPQVTEFITGLFK
jgi:hypothetical protein